MIWLSFRDHVVKSLANILAAPDGAAQQEVGAVTAPKLSRHLAGVRCFACNHAHDPRTLLTVCAVCGMPLRVDYDLAAIRLRLSDLAGRAATLWRYRELLPLEEGDETSLAEGFTPLLQVERQCVGKGRGAQSDRIVQGARHGARGVDGEASGRARVVRAVGGKRRGRAGRLRRARAVCP